MLDVRSAVHIHEDDLELYLRGQLQSERASSVEQHLLECDTCRECLSVCLGHQLVLYRLQGKPESPQKRSEPRFSAEGEAILQAEGSNREHLKEWPRDPKSKSYFSGNSGAIAD
jgi:hypothetical protein